jgi:hypothetical protein
MISERRSKMIRLLAVLSALGLGACATPGGAGQARPVAAEIIRAALVVHLADGQRCVALAPFTEGAGGFGNCDGLTWKVTSDAQLNPLRRIVEQGLALISVEGGGLYPMALIEVTDARGRVTSFVSPPADARR